MSHHYISFTNVSYTYPSGYKALDDVSFMIRHGEKVALIGLNGAGKSTLLLHTNGLLLADKGVVNVGDVPVTKKTLKLVRQSVGLVFQNPDDQLFMPTVGDDVAFGPINKGLPDDEVERRVVNALTAVGCLNLRHRSPLQMSGGQKRSAAIATVLSMEPSILVMDEPTSNLDLMARHNVIDLLKSFDHTLLVATHDLDMVSQLCPRTIVMKDGKILADGVTDEILSNSVLMASAGLV